MITYTNSVAVVLLVAVVASTPNAGAHTEVRPGDAKESVIARLGEPRGYLQYEDRQVLYYQRGRVELLNGEVVVAKLVSEDALVALQEKRERQREERLHRQRAWRARLLAEGLALREEKLNDPDFRAAPASDRVAFWRLFVKKYPGVPVEEAYETALIEMERALLQREREAVEQQRLALLEERVRHAEDRAARAEDDARRSTRGSYCDGRAHGARAVTFYPAHSVYYQPYDRSLRAKPRVTDKWHRAPHRGGYEPYAYHAPVRHHAYRTSGHRGLSARLTF